MKSGWHLCNISKTFKSVCMGTIPEKVWRLFLRSAAAEGGLGSRAGLFRPLIYGGVLPPPASHFTKGGALSTQIEVHFGDRFKSPCKHF